ncbi:MAG: 50S ribosomal protein L10 [Candidatus Alcyoniella australis]|nr:50S ribosomal protein L10 [Candidatus Alcyoniella australis]
MNREQKQKLVARLLEEYDRAQAVMLVNPIGLTVEQATALREQLTEQQARMEVVKNTITRLAGQENDLGKFDELLSGPNALVFSYGDPVACAKALADYAKEHPKFSLKAGLLSGKLISDDEIKALARMPSRDELLAQFAGQMESIVAGLPRAMGAILRGMPNVIQAFISKQEAAA